MTNDTVDVAIYRGERRSAVWPHVNTTWLDRTRYVRAPTSPRSTGF